jgi:hypothetical protein
MTLRKYEKRRSRKGCAELIRRIERSVELMSTMATRLLKIPACNASNACQQLVTHVSS